jgi:hypothetical protein
LDLIEKSAEEGKEVELDENPVPLYFKRFLGNKLKIGEASEPSDIIWENREVTPKFRRRMTICVWIIISIMLTISGCVIYVCSYTSTSLKLRYPVNDCVSSYKYYKTQDAGSFEKDAFREFLLNEDLKKAHKKTNYKTAMQCFCR